MNCFSWSHQGYAFSKLVIQNVSFLNDNEGDWFKSYTIHIRQLVVFGSILRRILDS